VGKETSALRAFDIFWSAESGERQHRHVLMFGQLPQPAQKLKTIHARHGHIRNNDIEVVFVNNLKGWNEGRGVFAELDAGFASISEVRTH
jgi:hypothetical protein